MQRTGKSGTPKTAPKGEPRPYFCNLPDELRWEREQARGPDEPWHPVDDCMELVSRVLDPERFDPAAWPDMGLPNPSWELKRLDPEGMCQIWLRNFLNPADADDYRGRLDALTQRWEAWKAAAVQRKPDLDATTDLTAWLDEPDNRDLRRELLDIRGDARETCGYLHTLAIVIRSKEAKRETGNATTGSGESGTRQKPPKKRMRRNKTPAEVLKEARERHAAKWLASRDSPTVRGLARHLECSPATASRLEAWKNRGVNDYELPKGYRRKRADDEGMADVEAIAD